MPIVPYDKNPQTSDTILFDLFTPMSDGCFTQQPVSFDSIKIFFISRSPVLANEFTNQQITYDPLLQRAVYVATEDYCVETDEQIKQHLQILKERLESQLLNNALVPTTGTNVEPGADTNTTYYYESVNVFCAGIGCADGGGELWIQGEDNSTAIVQRVEDDPKLSNGHFRFLWIPGPIKEGDFFICYSYTMQSSAYTTQTITKYLHFYVSAAIQTEVAIPSHACPPEKYFTLLNNYLPRMYFEKYSVNDDSVFTLEALNQSIGKSFTDIDNQVSRLIDILDANVTPEPYLPLLANMFALKLRSLDITRWRGQIVTAVPQFKKKGTLESLKQAFSQAGITLTDYFQYWQIAWPQVYTQTLVYTNSYEFVLDEFTSDSLLDDYSALFKIQLAVAGTSLWVDESLSVASFSQNAQGQTVLTWDASVKTLSNGDQILITYVTENMTSTQVALYEYWRDFLPLQDFRDYFLITPDMPPKNWNMRLILQDDPLFSVFIPVRNPFYNPIVFGQIRTEFPYSENVYNMDEYNGSLRDSTNPADMAPSYLETCSGAISAYYGLTLLVSNLSDFRISECIGIVNDYTPFHSVLRTLNIVGTFEDFILPPIERIEWLINTTYNEYFIAGDAQFAFNRRSLFYNYGASMAAYTNAEHQMTFFRTDFATENMTPLQNGALTVYNKNIVIRPQRNVLNFNSLNIQLANNLLEILDGPKQGNYVNKITQVLPYSLVLDESGSIFSGITTGSPFGWRLSNTLTTQTFTVSNFYQFSLTDKDVNFLNIAYEKDNQIYHYAVKTQVEYGPEADYIQINGINYTILYLNNNSVYLENKIANPLSDVNANGVTYKVIISSTNETVLTSLTGEYKVCKIAKFTGTYDLGGLCYPVPSPDLYYFDDTTSQYYKFYSIDPNDSMTFYVMDFDVGLTPVSKTGTIYNRLIETIGSFEYTGLVADISPAIQFFNPETVILRNLLIPERTILTLEVGSSYYDYSLNVDFGGLDDKTVGIVEINGYFLNVGTQQSGGGQSFDYAINEYNIIEIPQSVQIINGQTLYYVDRAGQDVWTYETSGAGGFMLNMNGMKQQSNSHPNDVVKTNESISFVVQTKDGQTQKSGEIK